MKAFKGFDKDLKCRGFQYELGKEYSEEKAELCERGFHACENPIDVFSYYSPAESRYCEVEVEGLHDKKSDDSKIAGTHIRVCSEIGIVGIVKAFVEFTMSRIDKTKEVNKDHSAATNTGNRSASTNTGDQSASTNTGDHSAATNTGDQSASTNTGDHSAATNTGDQSAATNTGYQSAATNTGDHSAATNTGNRSAATNTGDHSAATNTGDRSAATNTGDHSAATNTGDQSAAAVSGKESIASALGIESKAKGALGCWIVVAEWESVNNEWHIACVKSAKVDGKRIKANVFYTLKDKKFVEVTE